MKPISRSNEGALLIRQDNDAHTLVVLGMNEMAKKILECDALEEGTSLLEFLAPVSAQDVRESVVYDDDEHDLHDMLSKHRTIMLRTQSGKDCSYKCKIVRLAATDRHHRFRLIIMRDSKANVVNMDMQHLHEQFEGYRSMDVATQLPDRAALMHYVELTQSFCASKGLHSCVVALRCTNTPDGGNMLDTAQVIRHVGHVIARNLRSDDVVGRLDDHTLGMILIDINIETVHLGLNRIKHMMRHDPVTLSTGEILTPHVQQSCVILTDQTPDDIVESAIALLQADPKRDIVVKRDIAL